ncbi:MAG: SIMPL domain-containing protein [Patescibacteria group bacterium]
MFQTEEGKRLFKWASVAFIVLSVFLAVEAIHALISLKDAGREVPPMNLVTLNGMGEVFAVPDIASFSFGANIMGKTVAEAQTQVTQKIDAALAILKKYNVEDKDIKTTSYSINPRYEYVQVTCFVAPCPPGRSVITGYDVGQNILVKVRKTEDAGAILGELGTAGLTDASGIQFTIDDEDALKAEARKMAIADAKEKAKMLAKDLGVKLGDVVSFYENEGYGYPYANYGMGGDMMKISEAASAPELPVGENKIVSNVSVTYEIR